MDNVTYQKTLNFLRNGILPSSFPSTKSNFISTSQKYTIVAGQLQRNAKWVVQRNERDEIFEAFHQHSGVTLFFLSLDHSIGWYDFKRDKTHAKIRDRYYWYGGEKFIRQKVKECTACACKNSRNWNNFVAPLQPIPVTPKTMFRLHVDLCGAFKKSKTGNKYVALAVDAFTKYAEGQGNISFL